MQSCLVVRAEGGVVGRVPAHDEGGAVQRPVRVVGGEGGPVEDGGDGVGVGLGERGGARPQGVVVEVVAETIASWVRGGGEEVPVGLDRGSVGLQAFNAPSSTAKPRASVVSAKTCGSTT